VVVNAIGDIVDPSDGQWLAGARKSATSHQLQRSVPSMLRGELLDRLQPGTATTIGVVATDAQLDKAQCTRLATMAHDGLARTISPSHTPLDGDTLFALASGSSRIAAAPALLGALAAEVVARAVINAVRHAQSWPGLPAARDLTSAL
jgi:L-aminopeptidase/D-esterase-like protein